MRARFDQFMKQLVEAVLGSTCVVVLEQQVMADAEQRMDVWCCPDEHRDAERQRLGLLGRMASEPAQFEAFHDTPGTDDVLECVRKQLTWWRVLAKRARDADPAAGVVPLPVQWVLSSGRPVTALAGLGLSPLAGFPAGVYACAPAWRLRVVVLSELPRERETLLLRLMGAGSTLRAAITELLALPEDAWERRLALPLLVRLRFEVPEDPSERTADEEVLLMNAQEMVDAIERRGIEKGIEKGFGPVARLLNARLGRPLSEAERTMLLARLDTLDSDRLNEVLLGFTAEALEAWLADPAAR